MRRRNFLLIILGLLVVLVVFVQIYASRKHVSVPDLLAAASEAPDAETLPPPHPSPGSKRASTRVPSRSRAPTESEEGGPPRFVLLAPALGLDPNAPAAVRRRLVELGSMRSGAALGRLHARAHFLRRVYAEHHDYPYVLDDGTAQLPVDLAVGDDAAGPESAFSTLDGLLSAAAERSMQPSAWFKVALIGKYLNALLTPSARRAGGSVWLVFMDTDLLIADVERSLESVLASVSARGVDVVVAAGATGGAHADAALLGGDPRAASVVDTSFMLVRVSPWARAFFRAVWALGEQYHERGPPAACGHIPLPSLMHERGAMQCVISQLQLGLDPFPAGSRQSPRARVFVAKPGALNTAGGRQAPFFVAFPECRVRPEQAAALAAAAGAAGRPTECSLAGIERAFERSVAANHVHENPQAGGAQFVLLPSTEKLLGGHSTESKHQKRQKPRPAATVALFTYVRRKDLRNTSLRELYWSSRVLREALCTRCGFDCITEVEPPMLLGKDAILDDDDDDGNDADARASAAAAEGDHPRINLQQQEQEEKKHSAQRRQAYKSARHRPGAHAHIRHKRQEAFWTGKWQLLHDILPHYAAVFVVPSDAFLVQPGGAATNDGDEGASVCEQFGGRGFFSVQRNRQRVAALPAANDADAAAAAVAHFHAVLTVDWRGTVSGAILAVRNTRWLRSVLSMTLHHATHSLHHGGAAGSPAGGGAINVRDRPQNARGVEGNSGSAGGGDHSLTAAHVVDIAPVVGILTATSKSCFYCADDADDAFARQLALASIPPDADEAHATVSRDTLAEAVNQANGVLTPTARKVAAAGGGDSHAGSATAAVAADGGKVKTKKDTRKPLYRVFVEPDHRRFNAYAFPADARHKMQRYRAGTDRVARFPRCGAFEHCFAEAARMYEHLLLKSGIALQQGAGGRWPPALADSSIASMSAAEISAQLLAPLPSLSAPMFAWRDKPLFRPASAEARGDGAVAATLETHQPHHQLAVAVDGADAPPVVPLRVPPAQFRRGGDVAVLIVVCASSRAAGHNNVHGEGDAVGQGREAGDVLTAHRMTFETKLAYAQRHGYDVIVTGCDPRHEDASWSKMMAAKDFLLAAPASGRRYGTVLQLDASLVVMGMDRSAAALERSVARALAGRSGAAAPARMTSVLHVGRGADGEPSGAVMLWRNRGDDGRVEQAFHVLVDAASMPSVDCIDRRKHFETAALRCAFNHALAKIRAGGVGDGAHRGAADPLVTASPAEVEFRAARARGERAVLAESLIAVPPPGTKILFGVPRVLLEQDASDGAALHGRGAMRADTGYYNSGYRGRGAKAPPPPSPGSKKRRAGGGGGGGVFSAGAAQQPGYVDGASRNEVFDRFRYRAGDFAAYVPPLLCDSGADRGCTALLALLVQEAHVLHSFGTLDPNAVPLLMLPSTDV